MANMVEQITEAMVAADRDSEGCPDYPELARIALESARVPAPDAIARAADRLGIAPSDVSRLVGTWVIMVEEMLR